MGGVAQVILGLRPMLSRSWVRQMSLELCLGLAVSSSLPSYAKASWRSRQRRNVLISNLAALGLHDFRRRFP